MTEFRDLTFASNTAANTNVDALRTELAALPELAGHRDAQGNMQAAVDSVGNPQAVFVVRFNDRGELVVSIATTADANPVTEAVRRHIGTAAGRHDAEALALHIKAATNFADLQARVTNNWLPLSAREIRDNFNRANENPATGWAKVNSSNVGRIKVISNQAATTATDPFDTTLDYFAATTFGPGSSCGITVPTLPATPTEIQLGLRFTNVGTSTPSGYVFTVDTSSSSPDRALFRVDEWTYTQIAAVSLAPLAAGAKLRFDAIGDQLRGYVWAANGWVQIIHATDDTYTDEGYAAIGWGETDTRIDDFEAGTL